MTSTAAADPATAARDGALAAYRQMWAAYEKASLTADPDEPSLAEHATGSVLSLLKRGVERMRDNDQISRGSARLYPRVVSLTPAGTPTEVGIVDCADTTEALLYHRDGGLVNDVPGGWRHVDATVVLTKDGAWKVSGLAVRAVGSCDGD